ncbi:MAG TPA: putative hydro-lyase [Pseudonocardia sp.]|nr:putative hydro-lyase [Pseudonocardia sp.]
MNAASMGPHEVRARIRSGAWRGVTTGACLGHVQANLVVLPQQLADEFDALCAANPQPLPLLERTAPGDAAGLRVAPGADLRTDLPRYHVLRNGVLDAEVDSLEEVWQDDFVAFLLGCSFSAENQLLRAEVRLRHLEIGQGVPMFITSLECAPAARFHGPVVVSMRPVAVEQVDRAIEVTARLPLAHGAPLHVGDPGAIGITDLGAPDWGDPIDIGPDEVPVFWACGVTPQAVLRTVRPELAVTHAPGHMFITDLLDEEIVGRAVPGLSPTPP